MNISFDNNIMPIPIESDVNLSFDDVAPLLRSTSISSLSVDDDTNDNNIKSTCNDTSTHSDNGDSIVPGDYDVLCGRDKTSFCHTGNKRFRVIVAMNFERYQNCATREDKTIITEEILEGIRECGGRFLKLNKKTGEYNVVSSACAHEKVSHALRSAKPKSNKPRKKRKIVHKPPTVEENEAFRFIYNEQQRIFREMLDNENGDDNDSFSSWQEEAVEYPVGV